MCAHAQTNLSPQCTDTLSAHQRHSVRSKGAATLAPMLRRGCVAAAVHAQEAPRAPSWCSGSPAPGCAPPPQRPGRRSRRAPAPDPAASACARHPPVRWRPAHRRCAHLQCPAAHALPASRKRGSGHCSRRRRCPRQCQIQLRLRARAARRFAGALPTSAVHTCRVGHACAACRPGAWLCSCRQRCPRREPGSPTRPRPRTTSSRRGP